VPDLVLSSADRVVQGAGLPSWDAEDTVDAVGYQAVHESLPDVHSATSTPSHLIERATAIRIVNIRVLL